jgi:hypothetical protein
MREWFVPTYQPGQPVPSATYSSSGFSVHVAEDGAIVVKRGDWISKYSKCLYGDALVGWSDFGRRVGGSVSPLADPDSITAGETLYHIPTFSKNTGTPAAPIPVNDAADSVLRETWVGIGIKGGAMGIVFGPIVADAYVFNLKKASNNFNLFMYGAKAGLGLGANAGLYIALVFNMRNPYQIDGKSTDWEFDWNVALGAQLGKIIKFGKTATKLGPVINTIKAIAKSKVGKVLAEATEKLKDAKTMEQVKSIVKAASQRIKLTSSEVTTIHDGIKSALAANKEIGEIDPTKGPVPVFVDVPLGTGAEISLFMKQLRLVVGMVTGGDIQPTSPDAPAK